jgi:hypothetical protein
MKYLFSLLILCLVLQTKAQSVLYTPYEKFDLRGGDYSVIGKVSGLIYTYRASGGEHFLDAWDDSMERRATVILDFFPEKIYATRFIAYADKMIVLFQSNEHGKIIQQAAILDGAGRLQGRVVRIDEAKTGFFGPSGEYFFIAVSEDKKQIVVYDASIKGSTLHLEQTLLDDNLQRLHHTTTSYNGENALTALPGIVDNAGTFYLPVTTSVGSRDYADGIWLLSLPRGNTKLSATELPLNGKYAAGVYMRMDNTLQRIYAGGFFSEKKAGNYEGVLFAQFSADSSHTVTAKQFPFDEGLRMASGERNTRHAFNDYQTRQLIIRNDGGFVLVAEDYYLSVRNGISPYGYYTGFYSPFVGTQNIREYHYGDVFALSFSSDGRLEWHAFVRKDQYSQEDAGAFSSYAFINTGGALGFLYNDYDYRHSRITLSTISDEGKVFMQPLNAGGGSDPDWMPRSGKQVSAHELMVPCLRRRQICFAKIVF